MRKKYLLLVTALILLALVAVKYLLLVTALILLALVTVIGLLYEGSNANLITPYLPPGTGGATAVYTPFANLTIINYSGFSLYNVSGARDYVLKPDSIGTITYKIYAIANITSTSFLVNNSVEFFGRFQNGTPIWSYPGVIVTFSPGRAQNLSVQTVIATFNASAAAYKGTALMSFAPPGICYARGAPLVFTLGRSPFSGQVPTMTVAFC